MKKLPFCSVAFAGFLAVPAFAGVKILDRSFDSSEVCPGANSSKCIMKSNSAIGTYVGSDRRYINLDANGNPEISEYIGHLYTRSLAKAEPYCRKSHSDVFSEYAVSSSQPYVRNPYEYSFSIKEKVSKLLNASARVDVVEAAKAAGVPSGSLHQVAAAISTSYNKVRGQNVELKGVFRYYEINPNILVAFNSVDGAASLQQCKQWLKDNQQQVVVGLTGYKLLDAGATIELTTKFANDLKATLGSAVTDSQIAALTTSFVSDVERKVEGRFSPNFELLTVAVAP